MSTTLLLIRHGKTAANLENRFAGRTREPLHPSGRDQICGLAGKLKSYKPRAVYAGPLPRTRQSAEIIGRIVGAEVRIEEAFNEIYIPHWDGLTKEEITDRFGPEYPTWLSAPARFHIPGCETLNQVRQRAVGGVEEIFQANHGERIVVVSHLIVVRCLILHYMGHPIDDFRTIKVDNGAVTKLTRSDGDLTEVVMGG